MADDKIIADNGEHNVVEERHTVREAQLRDALMRRLNTVEGQVRGVRGMIERDAYCEDVLNQIAAIRSALNAVSKIVLDNHIHGCVVERLHAGEAEVVDELVGIIGRLL
jgi:DNA-binding FrmR family transcriptional regulator